MQSSHLLVFLFLFLLPAPLLSRPCPNFCFSSATLAMDQCKSRPLCTVRRCRGVRLRYKCGLPLRLPAYLEQSPEPSLDPYLEPYLEPSPEPSPELIPASCSIRALARGNILQFGCTCVDDMQSIVQGFTVQEERNVQCVAMCMTEVLIQAGWCFSGLEPPKDEVIDVLGMGFGKCCGECRGNLEGDGGICRGA